MAIETLDIEFTKDGAIFKPVQLDDIVRGASQCSDLLVLCHGWNNDMADARDLYSRLLRSINEVVESGIVPTLGGRTFAAVSAFWPSKRFTDKDLIPGGGAASAEGTRANRQSLMELLERMKADPDRLDGPSENHVRLATIERMATLVPQLEKNEGARREFVFLVRTILDPDDAHEEDGSLGFFVRDPAEIFAEFGKAVKVPLATGGKGAVKAGVDAGGAAGLKDLLSGATAAARRILNFATYYEMKERAGTVGRNGLARMLLKVRQRSPALRLHLIGHSFGGRLVTAAAHELPSQTAGVTMSLLQAAYSHNGLAHQFDGKNDGAFRSIVTEKRISGPIVITHTKNDRAVGIAYPLASRVAFQKAAAMGDENDPYGGMGRNGAQHTPEAEKGVLKAVAKPYVFVPGRIYNLQADKFISDHSDISKQQVAYAVMCAAGAL